MKRLALTVVILAVALLGCGSSTPGGQLDGGQGDATPVPGDGRVVDAGHCGNGDCEPGEDCVTCPADCPDCDTCPNGACDNGEDCLTCSADCGPCPLECGDTSCDPGEHCAAGPDGFFCTTCDPDACSASGVICCPHNAATGECTNLWEDPDHCGGCNQACPPGQRCLTQFQPIGAGPFCTHCDPAACAAFGVHCCPHNAPDGGCTNTFIDRQNCGACNVVCAMDQTCNMGVCEPVDIPTVCPFDPMQWWRSPTDHDARDVTFVAIADTHAEDETAGCPSNGNGAPDQNVLAREAINSVVPGPFWTSHLWPAGSNFFREGQPFDHVRGVLIAGDLTQAGSESIPAGTQLCWEYTYYRDAFGRCGNEGRLAFPVYDGYGNHDFPRSAGDGDVSYHPVIDRLDAITAAHRPGAANHKYDDPDSGTGHYAWRWDDIWFVNMDVKPGWMLETLPGTGNTRIVDPHGSRGFLKDFLLSRTNNATRQIVLLGHYNMGSGRIDPDEKESLCRLLHNAQHASGDFSGQKLSLSFPVVAFIHGHNHHVPEHTDWTCPSPYDAITIPHFSVGTPLYLGSQNDGYIHFSIFRLGSNQLEVVGVGAPASNPTGPWTTVYGERLNIMNAP